MLTFPNAKINLGLNIVSKRPDGYHNIESCFYPIPWCDVLEIIPSKAFEFTSSGLTIPGGKNSNLCIKAYDILKTEHNLTPVKIHLHKVIPMGAGLGGGSSDGAFTIKMLNKLFNLQLENNQMEDYAGQLGSDCPFFIRNQPIFAKGTGMQFEAIDLDLSGKYIAIKHPGIHVDTKEAYANVVPSTPDISIKQILTSQPDQWKLQLKNDFEDSVFPQYPELKTIKEELYNAGAVYASMSGSGSAMYGIFNKKIDLKDFFIRQL